MLIGLKRAYTILHVRERERERESKCVRYKREKEGCFTFIVY